MTCASCASTVREALRKAAAPHGAGGVAVDLASGVARVDIAPTVDRGAGVGEVEQALVDAVEAVGFEATLKSRAGLPA